MPAPAPTCECGQPATHGHQRPATPDEAAAYLANMDTFRVSQGLEPLPEHAAIRHADHHVAVNTCRAHRADTSAACPCCPEEAPEPIVE